MWLYIPTHITQRYCSGLCSDVPKHTTVSFY